MNAPFKYLSFIFLFNFFIFNVFSLKQYGYLSLPSLKNIGDLVCIDSPLEVDQQVLFRLPDSSIAVIHKSSALFIYEGCLDRHARLMLKNASSTLKQLLGSAVNRSLKPVSGFSIEQMMVINFANITQFPSMKSDGSGLFSSTQAFVDERRRISWLTDDSCDQRPPPNTAHPLHRLLCEKSIRQYLRSTSNIFTLQRSDKEYELHLLSPDQSSNQISINLQLMKNGYNVRVSILGKKPLPPLSSLGTITVGACSTPLESPTHYIQTYDEFTSFNAIRPLGKNTFNQLRITNQQLYGCPALLCLEPYIDAAFYVPNDYKESVRALNTTSEPLPLEEHKIYIFVGLYYFLVNPNTRLVPRSRDAQLITNLFSNQSTNPNMLNMHSFWDTVFLHQDILIFTRQSNVQLLRINAQQQLEITLHSLRSLFPNYEQPHVDVIFDYKKMLHLLTDSFVQQYIYTLDHGFMTTYKPFPVPDRIPVPIQAHLLLEEKRFLITRTQVFTYTRDFKRTKDAVDSFSKVIFNNCNKTNQSNWIMIENLQMMPMHFVQLRQITEFKKPYFLHQQQWYLFATLVAIACASVFALLLLMRSQSDFHASTESSTGSLKRFLASHRHRNRRPAKESRNYLKDDSYLTEFSVPTFAGQASLASEEKAFTDANSKSINESPIQIIETPLTENIDCIRHWSTEEHRALAQIHASQSKSGRIILPYKSTEKFEPVELKRSQKMLSLFSDNTNKNIVI